MNALEMRKAKGLPGMRCSSLLTWCIMYDVGHLSDNCATWVGALICTEALMQRDAVVLREG